MARLLRSNTAIFLCDLQERFRPLIFRFDLIVPTARKLLQTAHLLDIPVFAAEHHVKVFGNIVKELDVSNAALKVSKMQFSMFTPEVFPKLEELRIKSVVLFGIEAHICVTQTALDLLEKNYSVYVVADGVSSMNPQEIPLALDRLRQEGARIVTSESLIFELLQTASDPLFKPVAGVVKQFSQETQDTMKVFGALGRGEFPETNVKL